MKFNLLVFFAMLTINGCLYSQITLDSLASRDTINTAYQAKMNEMLAGVDFSYVPSGILYDRGFSFINLEPFNGTITDRSESSMLAFGLAYASLETMTVDSLASLPPPSTYRNTLDSITSDSEVILIAGIHQEYHQIDTLAIVNGLFSQSGDNISDVFPRSESPYVKKELFLFAPAELSVNSSIFKLRFDSSLFYSNTGKTVDSLFINLGSGGGYVSVDFNQDINAIYSTGGSKNVQIKMIYTDSSTYYSHFDIIVADPSNLAESAIPDFKIYIEPIYDVTDPSKGRVGGWLSVYYACGHNRMEKPFIWAEAYNPNIGFIDGQLTPDHIFDRINHVDGTVDYKRLWDHLLENGYDIVIMDYDKGTDYLTRTSEFIKESLRWINTEKASNGSSAKNVIIGQSMGGVCTALALKEMEEISEEDHEVEKFFIFDSPIRGANIPLGVQASLQDIAFTWVDHPLPWKGNGLLLHYVEQIQDLVTLLYEPATRTMMTHMCNEIKIYGLPVAEVVDDIFGIETDHLYTEFYSHLHDTLGGLPENCEVLTITNGSRKGGLAGKQNFNDGDLIIHSEGNNFLVAGIIGGLAHGKVTGEDFEILDSPLAYGANGILLWESGFNASVDLKVYAMKDAPNFEFYSSNIEVATLWGLHTIITHSNSAKISDQPATDHGPGGFFASGNQGLILNPDSLGLLMPTVFKMQTWCFTPTGSVLNYKGALGELWWDDPMRGFEDNEGDIGANRVQSVDSYLSNSETRSWGTADTYQNTAHTWLTEQNATYFHAHLIGNDELSGITTLGSSQTFNYGKRVLANDNDFTGTLPMKISSILDHSLNVNNTTLGVSMNDLVGLTPSPYAPDGLGAAKNNSHFSVNIGPLCEPTPAVQLTIENNAELVIGDGFNRAGSVYVNNGHSIVVKDGGELRIRKDGTLKIKTGASLTIEDGGSLIIEDDGALFTAASSSFILHEGSEIHLRGSGAFMDMSGDLYLFPNADFNPKHDGVASGYIVWNKWARVDGGAGSTFQLNGDFPTDVMITINNNAKLIVNDEMELLRFRNCKVLFRSEEDFPLQSFAPFESSNVTYEVQSNLVTANHHPYIALHDKSVISHSSFTDVFIRATPFGSIDGFFVNMLHSDFISTYKREKTQCSILGGNAALNYCDFGGFEGIGLELSALHSFSYVYHSSFTAFDLHTEAPNLARSISGLSHNETRVKYSSFTYGEHAIEQAYGQVSLRCNTFDYFKEGLYIGPNTRLEIGSENDMGYNTFTNIKHENIRLRNAQFLSIHKGYNYFVEPYSTGKTIEGTVNFEIPPALVLLGQSNQWNPANSFPAGEFAITSHASGSPINYLLTSPMSAFCGVFGAPISPTYDLPGGSGGSSLPAIVFTGDTLGTRLDSAISYATSYTELWDSTKNDLTAIEKYHDILMHQYSQQELADTTVRFLLNIAHQKMKHTVGHAITEGTISISQNQTAFTAPIQDYVDVLNRRSEGDTISLYDYVDRFYIEIDKANLLRAMGHTDKGLDILKNTDLCVLDSSEQVAMNFFKFVFEEQVAKELIGVEAYQKDTTYTDSSAYTQPSASQATEYYFGSVINSPSSITYRHCSAGSKAPQYASQDEEFPFKLYPNPSQGEIRIEYDVPVKSTTQLIIYSIQGKEITRIDLKGGHRFKNIDISHVSNGIYIYRLNVDGASVETGRISIAR